MLNAVQNRWGYRSAPASGSLRPVDACGGLVPTPTDSSLRSVACHRGFCTLGSHCSSARRARDVSVSGPWHDKTALTAYSE